MKRLIRPAAIVMLVVAITLPAAADKAKSLYNKGKDAEARQNYEQAYDYYKQAYELKPKDIQYRASFAPSSGASERRPAEAIGRGAGSGGSGADLECPYHSETHRRH